MRFFLFMIGVVFLLFSGNPAWGAESTEPYRPTIIIDPGHGGQDPGALGKKIREKDVVLTISKKLAQALKKKLNAKILYTRPDDRFISLGARDRIANRNSCDLFLSIHANASTSPQAHGIEVYYLNKATDSASRRLANRENAGAPKKLKDTEAIVSDLIQTAATEESADLAGYVKRSLHKRLKPKSPQDIRVRTALFYVLVGAKCPSLLLETGFVTNPSEAGRLKKASYQKSFAEAVADGVARYLERNHPGGDL